MKPLQNIAILSNASQKGAEEAGLQLKQLAEDHGIQVKISEEFPVPCQFLEGMDACFVMGGDGTLLSLLEQGVRYGVPVAGVRYGKLGFLATFSPEDLDKQIALRVFAGSGSTSNTKVPPGSSLFLDQGNDELPRVHYDPAGGQWYLARSQSGANKGWIKRSEFEPVLDW